jgi:opacity protein-like surface antigen
VTIRLAAGALLATLLAAPQARAQSFAGDAYVFARLGAYSPQKTDLDGYGTGFEGELGLGYRFIRYLAVEGAVGSYRSKHETMSDPVSGASIPGTGALSVVLVTGTLRAMLPLGPVEISALGGLGVYWASLDGSIPVMLPPYTPDKTATVRWPVKSTDRVLGAHVGAGAGVDLTPRVSLGVDLRYVFATAKLFDTTTHIGGLRVGGVVACRF